MLGISPVKYMKISHGHNPSSKDDGPRRNQGLILASEFFLPLDMGYTLRLSSSRQDPYLRLHKNIPYRPLTDDRRWPVDQTPAGPFLTVGSLRSAFII